MDDRPNDRATDIPTDMWQAIFPSVFKGGINIDEDHLLIQGKLSSHLEVP